MEDHWARWAKNSQSLCHISLHDLRTIWGATSSMEKVLKNCGKLAWQTHHNTSWFMMQQKWLCILAWVQICVQYVNVCDLIIDILVIYDAVIRCPSKLDDALTEWLRLGHFGTLTANTANDPVTVSVTKMISFKKTAEQHPKGYTMKFRNAIGGRVQQGLEHSKVIEWK